MAAISDLLQGSLSQLTSLIDSDVLSDHTEEVPLQEWRDELGRLRVWAANIGAHQTRQSSLDYRLRDASHIKSQIIRLLNHVQELLIDLEDVLEDSEDEAQDDRFKEVGDISGNENPTEIQEIHQSLVDTITQLYQMSMIIRNPAQHDRLVGTDKLDSEPFQFWAKQHTSTKYPDADTLVIDRISSAMARQRAILKYRERHHAKLSQGLDFEGDGKSTMLSETVVTDVFHKMPGECSDMISDAGASETSYGGTLLEGTSADAPRIPPIPRKGAEQRPFECPYCFYIITVRDKRAWARHIFRDLMPYICIFPGCSTPTKLYDGRRQWYHHIRQTHTLNLEVGGMYDCSICREGPLPTTTFQRHVGQHLEELALFLLPRTEREEDKNHVSDEEDDLGDSGNDLSDTSREENYPVEERSRQREDVNNAAIPASSPDIDDDRLPRWLREKHKHLTPSVRSSLRDGKPPSFAEPNMELLRQQREIERLEHDLDRHRAQLYRSDQSQLPGNNEEYEDEIEKIENRLRKLEMLQEWEEKQKVDKLKKEITVETMRNSLIFEELRRFEEERKKQENEKAKKKEDRELADRLQLEFGHTEEDIEKTFDKQKEKSEKEKSETHKKHTAEDNRKDWIKVHRRHLLPETLQAFKLPWDWDERDDNYIIIKQWVTEDLQEELFADTRRIRENKLIVNTSNPSTGLGFRKSVREPVQENMANTNMQTASPHKNPVRIQKMHATHRTRGI